ncbi:Retrovirus-related Pol polyprotein from transposon 17.6, partial [Mucuna pruriens]
MPIWMLNNKFQSSLLEQEDKLLSILRQHKKAIGWKLSDLPRINSSIYMHKILVEKEAKPIRQQQRRMNTTILDVVKKEVTKLLTTRIIYPISDSQWVSSILGKTSRCMQIHIAPEDQYKTTFTCPFGTFTYTHMPFGLCNALSTFQCCMTSIFSDLLQDCMEVFMDDFTMYADSFDACLENLSKGIVLGHLVSNRGIEVDKLKIDIITSLPNPTSVREVHSCLGHARFYRIFIKNFNKIALLLSKLLQKDVEFKFDLPCIEAFQE